MNEEIRKQLEEYCKQSYQKLITELTNFSLKLFDNLYINLPTTMTEEDKLSFIKNIISSHADSLIGSVSAFDFNQMTTDMVNKLKEQANG
jgi:hypothetical protein